MKVDDYLRTSAPHIFAAGDVTGRLMLVPPAIQEGFVAATNAVLGPTIQLGPVVNTSAEFTDPEYASAGLTEAKARETHDILTAVVTFDFDHPHDHRWAQDRFLQARLSTARPRKYWAATLLAKEQWKLPKSRQ